MRVAIVLLLLALFGISLRLYLVEVKLIKCKHNLVECNSKADAPYCDYPPTKHK